MRILANENFPRDAVELLRAVGHDVLWVRTACPGIKDNEVLRRAVAEKRVLFTFDKDFGALAYRQRLPSACGIVLFRISVSSPERAAARIAATIGSRGDWTGHFAVIDDSKIRLRPLLRSGVEDTE